MGMPYDRRQEMLAAAREQLGGGAVRRRAGAPSAEKPGNNVDVVAALLNQSVAPLPNARCSECLAV